MSDNWLQYIPKDPGFQPSQEGSDRATKLLTEFFPEAEEVNAEFHNEVTFFHPGANWSGVRCPACGSDVEDWWNEALESASNASFVKLECVTPCCGAETSLQGLHYVWPAAFGRFSLEAMNPNVKSLRPEHLEKLQTALGCELCEIALHI